MGEFGQPEHEIKQIVTSDDLRRWLRGVLDTQSVFYGPLTTQKQFRIISWGGDYVALTNRGRLERVVDRDKLAVQAATAQLGRRLDPAS